MVKLFIISILSIILLCFIIYLYVKRNNISSEIKILNDFLNGDCEINKSYEGNLDYLALNKNKIVVSSHQKKLIKANLNKIVIKINQYKNKKLTINQLEEVLIKYCIYIRLTSTNTLRSVMVELLELNKDAIFIEHAKHLEMICTRDISFPDVYYTISIKYNKSQRILMWLRRVLTMKNDQFDDIMRKKPNIIPNENILQVEHILSSIQWNSAKQIIVDNLDDNLAYNLFQKIISVEDNEIDIYYESKPTHFDLYFTKLLNQYSSRVKQRIEASLKKYFFTNKRFPCWLYSSLKNIVSIPEFSTDIYKEYLSWAEIFLLDRSEKEYIIHKLIELYDIVERNKVRIIEYKHYLLYWLILNFSDYIVPYLNRSVDNYNLSSFYTILNIIPEKFRQGIKLFFNSLDPSSESYPFSWTIYLKSKLRKKSLLNCLDIFVQDCMLWPSLLPHVEQSVLVSIERCFQHIDWLRIRLEKENIIQRFISKLHRNLAENSQTIDLEELRNNPEMTVLNNLVDGYLNIVKIGGDYAEPVSNSSQQYLSREGGSAINRVAADNTQQSVGTVHRSSSN